MERLSFIGPLWRWTGNGNGVWHFVTIDGAAGEALAATALLRKLEGLGRGWGSLRVSVTIGETRWQTSVFPQRRADGGAEWLLPVKASVRQAEALVAGEPLSLTLEF